MNLCPPYLKNSSMNGKKWQHKNIPILPCFIYKLYDIEYKFKGYWGLTYKAFEPLRHDDATLSDRKHFQNSFLVIKKTRVWPRNTHLLTSLDTLDKQNSELLQGRTNEQLKVTWKLNKTDKTFPPSHRERTPATWTLPLRLDLKIRPIVKGELHDSTKQSKPTLRT